MRWKREQRRIRAAPVPVAPHRVVDGLVKPDLPAAQSDLWDTLAPHAIKARKLTPSTLFAFRELLDTLVLKRATLSQISRQTMASPEAQGLITKYAALQTKADNGLALYGLLPARGAVAEEVEADPFAEFDQPLTIVQGGRA